MYTSICDSCQNKYQSRIICMTCDISQEGDRSNFKRKITTNADRIRAMSDEELAEWFGKIQYDTAYYCDGKEQKYPFPDAWLDWLRQECEL